MFILLFQTRAVRCFMWEVRKWPMEPQRALALFSTTHICIFRNTGKRQIRSHPSIHPFSINSCWTHPSPVKSNSSTKERGQRSLWTPVFSTCCRAGPMWVRPSKSTLRHRESSNLEQTRRQIPSVMSQTICRLNCFWSCRTVKHTLFLAVKRTYS